MCNSTGMYGDAMCIYAYIYIHIHIYYEAYIYITNKHDVGLFNITNINEDTGVSMETYNQHTHENNGGVMGYTMSVGTFLVHQWMVFSWYQKIIEAAGNLMMNKI